MCTQTAEKCARAGLSRQFSAHAHVWAERSPSESRPTRPAPPCPACASCLFVVRNFVMGECAVRCLGTS